VVRSLSVVSFVIVGRQLDPAAFGVVALASGILAVLAIISDSGLATYIIRVQQLGGRTISTAFWTSALLASALAVGVAATAPLIASGFDVPELTPVLWAMTSILLVTGASSVPNALLRRDLRFKALATRNVAASAGGAAVAIVLALAGAGVWALVSQAISQSLIGLVMLWRAVDWRPEMQFDRGASREMLSFGSKLLAIDLMSQARDRGEEFTLAAVASSTVLGYWSVAGRLVKLVQDTGSQVVSMVATPAFSKLQDDRKRLFRAYSKSMALAGAIIFPALLFLAVTSADVVPLVLGRQWAVTATVAQITAITAAVGVFSYFDRSIFVAVDKLKPEVALVAFIIALHLAVVVVLAPHGLHALALGLLARTVLTFPIRQLVLHKVAGVPYRSLVRPARVLLAATLMAAAVWTTLEVWRADGWSRLIACAAVGVVAYPAALFLVARPTAVELSAEATRLARGRLKRRLRRRDL